MTDQRFTAYAEKKAGTNNKFYEVEAISTETGAKSIFRWGRIGTKGQSKEHFHYSFEAAKRNCEEQIQAKKKRGYREVSALEALASCGEELDERETNGVPPVEIDIPCFHAGKSEKRCQQVCQQTLDKLNLIRASRFDLEYEEYEKQMETLFKSYIKTFKRIKESKTHGPNWTSFSGNAARIFFSQLEDHARCHIYVGHFDLRQL